MLKSVTDDDDMKNYFGIVRPEMLKFVPKSSKKFLEVGCGSGLFAKLVKQNIDCEYWAIEPYDAAAEDAKTIVDKIFNLDFDTAYECLPVNYFDCVIFNDVLEHFANPFAVLDKIFNILPTGGYIISSIPNVRHISNLRRLLINRDWHYQHDGGILDFTHLRFFTRKSILRMFEGSGFKIELIEGINLVPNYKFIPFNILTLGFFSDSKYLQYATIAKK